MVMPRYGRQEMLLGLRRLSQDNFEVTADIVDDMGHLPSPATYEYRFESFTEAKIKAGLDVEDAVKCDDCGIHYSSISKHWSQSKCSPNEITDKQKSIMVGHLMGDATLANRNISSPHLSWVMSNRDYMEWLNTELGWLSRGIKLKHTAQEATDDLSEKLNSDDDSYKCKALYSSSTHGHQWLKNLDWYNQGEKVFPRSIELNPTVVKVWYCDDGGLLWSERATNALSHIHMSSQPQALNWLKSKFEEIGFSPSIRANRDGLTFNVDDTVKLLNWMGEPPNGMEYKWMNDSEERYEELKR